MKPFHLPESKLPMRAILLFLIRRYCAPFQPKYGCYGELWSFAVDFSKRAHIPAIKLRS